MSALHDQMRKIAIQFPESANLIRIRLDGPDHEKLVIEVVHSDVMYSFVIDDDDLSVPDKVSGFVIEYVKTKSRDPARAMHDRKLISSPDATTHVDHFINGVAPASTSALVRHAGFVLGLHRLPAIHQSYPEDAYPLYARIGAKWYSVTMASRFGNIRLSSKLEATRGYDKSALWIEIEKWSAFRPSKN